MAHSSQHLKVLGFLNHEIVNYPAPKGTGLGHMIKDM